MKRATVLALALALGMGACAGASSSEPARRDPEVPAEATTPTDDELLIAAVRRAAENATPIESVEAGIADRAWISTTRERDRNALAGADLTPDLASPECATPGDLRAFENVVYWGRPLPDAAGGPRIVGLRYRASGEVEMFCAVVLPP